MPLPIIPYDSTTTQAVGGGILRAQVFGYSVCGRELIYYSLGQGSEVVLLAAGFHGQEWVTSYVLLRLMERLSPPPPQISKRLIFVPLVNPDGVDIAIHGAKSAGVFADSIEEILAKSGDGWNANARGVDINHNFDARWHTLRRMEIAAGITGPAPRRYGGAYPNSEPETRALVALTLSACPSRVLALHSQGEELYWEYGGVQIPGAQEMAIALADAAGYRLVRNGGLAAHGGYKDWFISEFRRPGFTVELGKGQNPLPLADFESIYAKVEPLLLLAVGG
ncbi:MAG: M14 family metallocarboxypeptidase [Clostridium sp.]|jgi:g-D-glutamyl-meso-diaminopimelate peptidase|nr:M14 family metallocarboxypeptidase [Clostridium sp.]